jgi:hypothetical protein
MHAHAAQRQYKYDQQASHNAPLEMTKAQTKHNHQRAVAGALAINSHY